MQSSQQNLTDITLTIFNLNGLLTDWGDKIAGEHGLTTAYWQVFGAIAFADNPPNVPQIAKKMGVTRQGTLKQVNNMLKDDYLVVLPNPTHKRSPHYALSAKGQQAFEQINQAWQQRIEAILPAFKADELAVTLKTLQQLTQIYQ